MFRAAFVAALAALFIFGVCVRSQNGADSKTEMESLIRQATEVKDRHLREIFKLPAVVGAGVGLSPNHPGKAVIQIFVSRKLGAKQLRQFPKALEGIPVEIQLSGPVKALPGKTESQPGPKSGNKK